MDRDVRCVEKIIKRTGPVVGGEREDEVDNDSCSNDLRLGGSR